MEQTVVNMEELTRNLDALLLVLAQSVAHLEHLLRELLVALHLGWVCAGCVLFLDCHDQVGKNRNDCNKEKQDTCE